MTTIDLWEAVRVAEVALNDARRLRDDSAERFDGAIAARDAGLAGDDDVENARVRLAVVTENYHAAFRAFDRARARASDAWFASFDRE